MKSFIMRLESWLRTKIRTYVWKQWKKVRTRYTNLRKFGIEESKAWQYANTRKGYWRTAHSPILKRTLTDNYIEKVLKLNSLINRYN